MMPARAARLLTSSDSGVELMDQMSSGSRLRLIAVVLIFLAYAGLRLASAPPVLEKPRILADTTAYTRISAQPIDQIDFWAGSRPPAFPLLLKIAQQDYNRTAALQLGISILAWGLLALAVSRFLKFRWLQVAGFALVLLFSLDRHIAAWDFVMMTESLSLSSLALFIAAGLWLLRGWHVGKGCGLLSRSILLAFTRDTNAWMLLGSRRLDPDCAVSCAGSNAEHGSWSSCWGWYFSSATSAPTLGSDHCFRSAI